MRENYGTQARDVHAIIGPCISLKAFEVGIEVYEAFERAGYDMAQIAHWHPEKEKFHIDLPTANRLQLQAEGVPLGQIYDSHIAPTPNTKTSSRLAVWASARAVYLMES